MPHRRVILGRSVEGRALEAHLIGPPIPLCVLVCGGFHGDEPKSVALTRRLINLLDAKRDLACVIRWLVIPLVNPDGFARRKRRNARKVDINRNFPTKDWRCTSRRSRMFGGSAPASEPETRMVMRAIARYRPARIVTVHSINRHRQCNNFDGPAKRMAWAMSRVNGYPVTHSIGYATPGSFGTWAGTERGIPTVTLELPSHHSAKRCWQDNELALLACAP